jgi:hypothetical protein
MKMDEYELELLESVDSAIEFKRVENFEEELEDARIAVKNFLNKSKNVNMHG